MTRHQLQVLTYSIAGVVFTVTFEVLDYLAGFNAGIALQWLVILVSSLVAFLVLLGVAVCIMAVSPPAKKSKRLKGY